MIQTVINFIGSCFEWIIEAIKLPLVWFGNHIISAVAAAADGILSALPGGLGLLATLTPPASLVGICGKNNWFIPMATIAVSLQMIVATFIVARTVRPWLKFFRIG